jgi:hypothetical protein
LVVRKLYKAVEGGSVSGVVGSQEKNSLKGWAWLSQLGCSPCLPDILSSLKDGGLPESSSIAVSPWEWWGQMSHCWWCQLQACTCNKYSIYFSFSFLFFVISYDSSFLRYKSSSHPLFSLWTSLILFLVILLLIGWFIWWFVPYDSLFS